MNVINVKCYVDDAILHPETQESVVKRFENVFAYHSGMDFVSG